MSDSRPAPATPYQRVQQLISRLEQSLLGKRRKLEFAVACILAEGHLLIEDVPGVGKTTLAKSLAFALGAEFKRVQFTSDLLPSDLIGVTVFQQGSGRFEFNRGPIFTHILLADEINRANPKTQSALLEAMHDGQISHDGQTMPLPAPFFVLATQNSKDNYGTFPLPESQLDRFLMKISLGYPSAALEKRVLRGDYIRPEVQSVDMSLEQLARIQQFTRSVHVAEEVMDFIYNVVAASRDHAAVQVGVSPRGGQALYRACQGLAVVRQRDYVTPDDVRELAPLVCGHRVTLNHAQVLTSVDPDENARQIFREILVAVDAPL